MNRSLVVLVAPIAILLVLLIEAVDWRSTIIEDEELIGAWKEPQLGRVEVNYRDDQKTRILVNLDTRHGRQNFLGAFTAITPRHLRVLDPSIIAPFELHLEWTEGPLKLYLLDGTNQSVYSGFQLQFSQFHGNGSFDLPETRSPSGLGKLNAHGQAMVGALVRNGGESWKEWVDRLHALIPELVLAEPVLVSNPESYPKDLIDFWKVCGRMELGAFPIVHSPPELNQRSAFIQPHYSKPIVMINDTDGWGYCLSRDSSNPFIISWDHEVDFEGAEELPGSLSDIIAERIAEIATVYPPFDLTYNRVFQAAQSRQPAK